MNIYLHPLCTFLDLNKEEKQLGDITGHYEGSQLGLQVFWEKVGKFLSPQALSTHPRGLWSSGQGYLSSRLEKPSYPLATQGYGKRGEVAGRALHLRPLQSLKVTYQRESQQRFQMTRRSETAGVRTSLPTEWGRAAIGVHGDNTP